MDHALTTSEAWKVVGELLKEQHPEAFAAIMKALTDAESKRRVALASTDHHHAPLRAEPHSHAWIRTELLSKRPGPYMDPMLGDEVSFLDRPLRLEGRIVGCTRIGETTADFEVIFYGASPPVGSVVHFAKSYPNVMPTAYVVSPSPLWEIDPEATKEREEQAKRLVDLRDNLDRLQLALSQPRPVKVSVVNMPAKSGEPTP